MSGPLYRLLYCSRNVIAHNRANGRALDMELELRTILDVAPVGGFPNIFVAVQKQLGLRLDQAADVPVDVIVIDSLNRTLRRN